MSEALNSAPQFPPATRVVTIIVNERCPLRCRHCSLGFSESYHGNSYRVDQPTLTRMIQGIAPEAYNTVLFAGGEPSLDPDLVKFGVDLCRQAGLQSAMVTAPVWAASDQSADRLLDKVDGLNWLILSYDDYHLEFLKFGHYETAARKALSRGIPVTFHITYSKDQEKDSLIASLAPLPLVQINAVPTVRVGNALDSDNVEMEYISIDTIEDLDNIPRRCILGNALVDSKLVVHGCCWSSTAEASPFSFDGNGSPLRESFHNMENSPVFQAVLTKGFLGSLSPKGKQLLFERVRGRRFCNECDICVDTMKEDAGDVWRQCRS